LIASRVAFPLWCRSPSPWPAECRRAVECTELAAYVLHPKLKQTFLVLPTRVFGRPPSSPRCCSRRPGPPASQIGRGEAWDTPLQVIRRGQVPRINGTAGPRYHCTGGIRSGMTQPLPVRQPSVGGPGPDARATVYSPSSRNFGQVSQQQLLHPAPKIASRLGTPGSTPSFLARLFVTREVPKMRIAPMLAMAMSLVAAACSKDTQLDSIARELETTVNRCVIDVRDKTSKYETSPNCRALSEIAKRYIAAGGLKQSAPCVADRIAEGAHAKAWMALAISKSGDPNLMIW
jgi:hypothetical protein